MTAVDKPAEPEAHADPNDDAAVGEDNGTDCVETPEDPKDAAVKKTQHAMELWAKDTPTQGSSAVPTPLDPLEAAAKEKEEWTNEWTESSPLDDEQPANDNPPPAVVAATAEIEEEVMQAKIESGGAVRPTSTAMSTDGDEQEAERGEAVDAVDQVMRDKLAGNVAYDATSSAASVAGSAPRAQSEIASCSANSPLAASPVREAAPAEDSVMQHRLATGGAPLQQQPSSAVSVAGGSSSAPREASEGVSVHSPVEECSPAREGAPVEDALMQHKLATGGANQQSSSSTESVLGSNHPAVSEGTSVHSPVVPESPAHEPAAEEASGMGLREKLAGGGGGDVQHSASTVSNANSSSTAHRGDVSPTPPGASGPNPSETSQFLPPASPVCEEPDLAEEEVMRLKIAAGGHSHPASSSTQSIDGSAAATDGRTPARGSAPSDNRLHSPPGTFESPFPEQASDAPVLGSDAGSSYLPPAEPTCDEPDAVEEEIMKRKFEDGAFGPPATSTVLSVDGSTRGLESPAGSRLGAGGGPDGRTLSTMSVDGSVAAERERDCADDPRLARLEAEKPGRTLSTMSVDGSVADNAEGATGAGDPFGSQLPQGPSAVPVPRLDRLGKPEGVRTLSTASIDGSAVDGEPKADLPDEDPKLDGEEPSTASPRVTAPLPSKPEDPSAPAQGHPAPAVTNPRAGSAAAGPPQPPSAMPHKKIYREKTPAARPVRLPPPLQLKSPPPFPRRRLDASINHMSGK
ncbi:hypothetical protein DIPPA_10814 [Diplonema papillatum]|nr:hypothetical protein DIPPA_10814 [Diplonema papillatum]